MRKKIWLWVIPLVFLVVSVATIKDYGINWDNPMHFMRGQAYFWYFLTGKKDFANLPAFENSECVSGNLGLFSTLFLDKLSGKGKCKLIGTMKRSFYQYDYYNFEYFVQNDSGHPVVTDTLSALTNYLLYQKLGIFGDTASYNIFIIVVSFVLVLFVAFFVEREFGLVPAMVSSLVLASYPLFFSESHFNIKDPPEAAFFGLALIFFYWGVVKNKWKQIIVSAIFAGLALGTKLNVVFAPLVVIPWLAYYVTRKLSPNVSFNKFLDFLKSRKMIILSLFLYLPICFGLVYALWPFLWQDPIGNVPKILGYYSQIGIGTSPDMLAYIFKGWNLYPIVWILTTTTIPVLLLLLLGLLFSFFSKNSKKDIPCLFVVLWLIVPVLRTSWPKAVIYGGVRQIMEYVPALAILCGIGVYALIKFQKIYLRKRIFKIVLYSFVLISLSFSVFEMVRIHPNENVYFNQLIGGLSSAKAKNIPSWGNTYGNVYLQGVKWINENAEKGAKIALPVAVMSNIPRTMLRSDLDYTKPHWSGLNRWGEYGIEMDYDWWPKLWYSFQYYDVFLNPVYEVKVDGVPLLKIWKNDLAHTKPAFREENIYSPVSIKVENNLFNSQLKIDLGRDIFLTRLKVVHSDSFCQEQVDGYVALSLDGKIWKREPEPITFPQGAPGESGELIGWNNQNFVYMFAGKKARYIVLNPQMENSCYLKDYSVEVTGLKILP